MRKYVMLFEEYGWPKMSQKEWDELYYEAWYEAESDGYGGFAKWLENGKRDEDRQRWDLVDVGPLKNVWEWYVRTGHVRESHYRLLRDALDLTIANVATLEFNCMVYDEHVDSSACEDYGFTKEEIDEFWPDYITNPVTGQCRHTDFGMRNLQLALKEAFADGTPEGAVRGLDKLFNVIHMQSDLSAMFVEGGSKALSELSGIQR